MRHNLGLRQLAAIVAIADTGSFSAAAVQMHVSQPALSRTIRLAEESLGAKLFERDTRTLSLTPAGAELLPIARRVAREFSDSMSDLAQFMEGRRGRIRVSALPSMAQSLLVDALVDFTKLHPQVEFLLRVDPADKVLGLLESRDIEIGLTVQPPPDGRFSYAHLHEDEFVLICRRDDPLATQAPAGRPLPWTVLQNRPFIAATAGSNTRNATDTAFMRAGMNLRPAHEVASSDLTVIGALVAAGIGLSVLPASTMPCLNQPLLVGRRLGAPRITRRVGVITMAGRTLSVAANRFCEHLLQSDHAKNLPALA